MRYNGSVARLTFGPVSAARVRRWLAAGEFDVLHVHEPFTPSLSLLAVLSAQDEPIVATFHTAMTRSRAMQAASGVLQLVLERITARIAVSAAGPQGAGRAPRRRRAGRSPTACRWPGSPTPSRCPAGPATGGAIGFLGRFTEPRKGFPVLLDAFAALARPGPGCGCWSPGRATRASCSRTCRRRSRDRITFLGMVSEADKARMLRSVDVYVAPNTGGESFGMILTEAMAAGTPVVASDLDAFRRVLDGGRPALFPVGDAAGAGRARWPSCWTTRRAGPSWPRAAATVVAALRLAGRGRAGSSRSTTSPIEAAPRPRPRRAR